MKKSPQSKALKVNGSTQQIDPNQGNWIHSDRGLEIGTNPFLQRQGEAAGVGPVQTFHKLPEGGVQPGQMLAFLLETRVKKWKQSTSPFCGDILLVAPIFPEGQTRGLVIQSVLDN